jgi:glucosamine--fructose-6-phosphate aminotransferase (isomerizing)
MNLQETHLYREIHEQPAALERFLSSGLEPVRALARRLRAEGIHHVFIAARGTSDNAGRYAQYLFGIQNRLLVSLATPSLFSIYQRPPDLRGSLTLGISQSGQSPDLVAVLTEARRQGGLTAAITNYPDSPLGAAANFVIPLLAGEERSLAATKTYTAQLAALAALSALLGEDSSAALAGLGQVPAAVSAVLERQAEIEAVAERYRYMQHCVVIGRGLNYATAFELSLKLKELTYTIAEPYSSADFLHGPFALIEPGFPIFLIAPRSAVLPELLDFLERLGERRGEVIAISDVPEVVSRVTRSLPLPVSLPEHLSPITAIVPGQLFAMYLADTRGIDVDHPRGLTKVTETV